MNRTKRRLLVAVVVVMAVLLMIAPASAGKKTVVGDRISILAGSPTTYEAGAPFHIMHGWSWEANEVQPGLLGFELEVDGEFIDEDYKDFGATGAGGDPPNNIIRIWVFNFPNGLDSGEHTFIGHWFAPCQAAVNDGFYPGPCEHPNTVVEALTRELVVTFSP